jgi:hypothetical protein
MRAAYAKLIHLRLDLPALTSRLWQIVAADRRRQIFAFVRYGAGKPVLAVFNFGLAPQRAELSLPARFVPSLGGKLRDVVHGGTLAAGSVPLPPETARVLVAR